MLLQTPFSSVHVKQMLPHNLVCNILVQYILSDGSISIKDVMNMFKRKVN